MKKYFSLILLIVSGFTSISQSVKTENARKHSCGDMKRGKFMYREVTNSYSIRNDSEQVSYYPEGFTNTFKIKWVDTCKFVLIFRKSSLPDKQEFMPGDTIFVDMTDVDGDCYTFTAKFKGNSFPPTQMCKVSW